MLHSFCHLIATDLSTSNERYKKNIKITYAKPFKQSVPQNINLDKIQSKVSILHLPVMEPGCKQVFKRFPFLIKSLEGVCYRGNAQTVMHFYQEANIYV